MGSRGRSIRLRIYFLVAIPLIAMAGMLAYAAGTSISNAINLDRVPNLINASGIPAAKFGVVLNSERTAAVVYLFAPNAASLAAYQAAISATDKATPTFTTAMTSHAVLGSESPAGAREIETILGGLKQLPAAEACGFIVRILLGHGALPDVSGDHFGAMWTSPPASSQYTLVASTAMSVGIRG